MLRGTVKELLSLHHYLIIHDSTSTSVSDAFVVCLTSCSIKNTDVFSPVRCAIFMSSNFYCSALFEMMLSAKPEIWAHHEFQCSGTPVFSLLLSILLIINVVHAVFFWYFFQFS